MINIFVAGAVLPVMFTHIKEGKAGMAAFCTFAFMLNLVIGLAVEGVI